MGPWWEMNLEYLCQPEAVDKITSPRILATHVPFCMLPKQHLDNGYKIIYLRRNPKDRCVSLKCFLHGKLGHPTWTWPEFFDEIIMEGMYVIQGFFLILYHISTRTHPRNRGYLGMVSGKLIVCSYVKKDVEWK